MRKRTLGVLLSLLFLAAPIAAQEQRGGLEGTVKDNTGAVLPGVTVEARSANALGVQSAVTDANGFFRFTSLLPGDYEVSASLSGFSASKARVAVSAGQTPRLDIGLQVEGVAEQVQVTADATVLDMSSSKTATTISEKVIAELPRGRTFNTLLQMAPGVRSEPKSGTAGVGGYQVDGASGSENVFIVDGVDVSNVRRASLDAAGAVPFEFLQEVQVNSGGFSAEYGGALGGVVNVVSKSGTDIYRGEVLYQFSGDALNTDAATGNTPATGPKGTWRRDPLNQAVAEFFKPAEDSYTEQFYGFTLGGPIVSNKLRFFAGYIPQLYNTDRSVNFTSVGVRNSSSKELRHRGIGRVDYSPVQSLQINGSYFWNPKKTTGLLTSPDPKVTPSSSDLTIQGGYEPANSTSVGVNYIPSSRLLFSARYGFNYLNAKGNTYGKDDAPFYRYVTASSAAVLPVPPQWQQAANYTNIADPFQIQYDRLTRHNVYLDATYFASIGGQNHTFKGGYMLNRLADDVQSNYPDGYFRIFWGEDFDRASIVNARGPYGYYIWEDGVRLNSAVNSRNHGFYIQDAWQVNSRLTINAGVRFENEYLPPFRAEEGGVQVANPISFGWADKIAPRFGAAWDVTGTGKWKISGSYVRINDVLKYELARGSFGGDYWWSHVYQLNNPDLSGLNASNPGALGTKITQYDNRSVHINEQGEIDGIDHDIKPMAHDAFDVTSDFLLTGNTTFTIRYAHKALVRGIEDIGILDAEGSEIYTIGNPGFSETSDSAVTPTGASLVPKAKRDYDGIEFRLTGRKPNLYYNVSYTYSRLYGNWSGLASSDENGRSDPNVSRAFDLSPGNFDAKGQNVYGRLATDRPHTLKLFGSYILDSKLGSTSFGVSQLAYSGTPLSSEITYIVPVFYNGRGDLGRTEAFTQTDLRIAHGFRVGGNRRLLLEAFFQNLFDQSAVTNHTVRYNRNGSLNDTEALYNGTIGDVTRFVNPANGASPAFNPIYNLPSQFQDGRRITLGARFQF
jgi:Carboxypeptidase regulatory-like domain/TonB-dependent Receptor Plug Domain/TonB dependent receptor